MQISEAGKKSRLTKKAIEYYIEQKLIDPQIQENGYRTFSEKDIEQLKKISILRRIGISVQEIKEILDQQDQKAMDQLIEKKKLKLKEQERKNELFEQLAATQDWDTISNALDQLEKSQTILQKLLYAFPGYYGKYIRLHFARYLNEPILTKDQEEAYETIVTFLDRANFDLSPALQSELDKISRQYDEQLTNQTFKNMNEVIKDPEKFMTENKETLEQYLELMRSKEFRETKAYKLREQMMQLNQQNGYNTVFIPAMKRLSPSYKAYYDRLKQANEVFLQVYDQQLKIHAGPTE